MTFSDEANQERDDLAGLISRAVGGYNQNTRVITDVVDAILEAGYRKVSSTPETVTKQGGAA